jgi:serine/threonine-protein kinase
MGTARDPADEPPDQTRTISAGRQSGGVTVESGEALAETIDRASLEPADPSDALLAPGTMLPPSYRVERVLGRGGMGVVYLVEHVDLERRFAAKVVAKGVNEDHLARLRKEARVASAIRHPNIVDVVHLGRREDGSFFVVMEFLEGEDLGTRIERRWKESPEEPWLSDDEVRSYATQTFAGLAAAHAAGVIHRDLKPDNVFLTSVGGEIVVKLVDFGIAKAAEVGRDHGLTRTGQIIGTPLYMAPEQTRSTSDVDVRADLYAMGVILYEMVAGALPFEAETVFDLIVQHATKPPTPPRVHRPDLPEAVEAVILRCLEKRREDRFADVEELARAWNQAWTGGAVSKIAAPAPIEGDAAPVDEPDDGEMDRGARGAEPAADAEPPGGPEIAAEVSPGPSPAAPRPRYGPRVAAATLALLVVGGGAWWAAQLGEPAAPTVSADVAVVDTAPRVAEPTAPETAPEPTVGETAPAGPVTRLVSSEPPGAEVSRDGAVLGTTPIDVEVPASAPSELVLRSAGYEDSIVTLAPNARDDLRVELAPRARPSAHGAPLRPEPTRRAHRAARGDPPDAGRIREHPPRDGRLRRRARIPLSLWTEPTPSC